VGIPVDPTKFVRALQQRCMRRAVDLIWNIAPGIVSRNHTNGATGVVRECTDVVRSCDGTSFKS